MGRFAAMSTQTDRQTLCRVATEGTGLGWADANSIAKLASVAAFVGEHIFLIQYRIVT
jgi:hypothetical protein